MNNTNILEEHPAKRLNGTGMLLAMQARGKAVYGGTARPGKVAAARRRSRLAAESRRRNRA